MTTATDDEMDHLGKHDPYDCCPCHDRLAAAEARCAELEAKLRAAGDATAAWEAHKKAYEIVRAEMDDLHRTLTGLGVPEQIPPFKTGLAPVKARVLYMANATRSYTQGGGAE